MSLLEGQGTAVATDAAVITRTATGHLDCGVAAAACVPTVRSEEKAAFLQTHGEAYGSKIDGLRQAEFKRLGPTAYVDHAGSTLYSETQLQNVIQVQFLQGFGIQCTHLIVALRVSHRFNVDTRMLLVPFGQQDTPEYGSSCASSPVCKQVFCIIYVQDFGLEVLGNPHSQLDGGVGIAARMEEARRLTLQLCNAGADEYECVFTSGATGTRRFWIVHGELHEGLECGRMLNQCMGMPD